MSPVTDQQKRLARLVVFAHCGNARDAAELKRMLGIHPDQPDDDCLTSMPNHDAALAPKCSTARSLPHPPSGAPSTRFPRTRFPDSVPIVGGRP
jgi:hypothetical protein